MNAANDLRLATRSQRFIDENGGGAGVQMKKPPRKRAQLPSGLRYP
jgi:hypothetical protein